MPLALSREDDWNDLHTESGKAPGHQHRSKGGHFKWCLVVALLLFATSVLIKSEVGAKLLKRKIISKVAHIFLAASFRLTYWQSPARLAIPL